MYTFYLWEVSRNTLRVIIILAAVSIAGIAFTQIYWVSKAFDIRENQFNRDVNTALGNVAAKILEINRAPSPANNPVQQMATNYFVVLVNGPIDAGILEFLLISEFEKRNITAEFEYGIYDCAERCMVGGNYISPRKTKVSAHFPETPRFNNDGYYFAVQFPGLQANLISQMGIWGFSSAVLLVVIFFFVYTIFVILKQKRLSEVQRDFINNMTHEFRTPISTIAISSEVLRDPGIVHQPERLLNYSTIIQTEASRLQQQVERVLQMAQVEKSNVGLKLEVLNLHALIHEAVANHQPALETTGGQIFLDLSASHPIVMGDKLHLANVFYNLLDNAFKYNHGQPLITLKTLQEGNRIRISIGDNGIGIPSDALKRVFKKFYRVPTGNIHNVKGFGIGLSYVKWISEKLGGSISVESKAGKGSVFHIILPQHQP